MLVYLRNGYVQTVLHTEIEAADETFYLTQPQYTDTEPICPSTDPIITPGSGGGVVEDICFFVCVFSKDFCHGLIIDQ